MEKMTKKILVLRFGALGDLVHTTIIPQAIKQKYPDCEIHYCSESRYVEVLKNNPYIDKIIEFNQKRRKEFSYMLETALQLRHEHYDVVFNLTNAFRNNLMAFIASPKVCVPKVEMGRKHVVEAFFLSAKKVFPELILPENLILGLDKDAEIKIEDELKEFPRPFVILSPGGETDSNRQGRTWSAKSWIELANILKTIYGGTIFISGSPDEKEYHSKIAEQIQGAVLYSGSLSIAQTMALISKCDVFISGDSGPLHIASGLGVNAIGLYGSTNPKNVAPYGQKGFVVEPAMRCKYCWEKECKRLKKKQQRHTPCMNSIKPEHVLKLIDKNDLFGLRVEKLRFEKD